MERLTEKFVCNLPDEVLEKLGITDVPKENYEIKEVFGGATCKEVCEEHECSNCPINKVINKLADYEDAEEQGLLLRLPCKIGDTVYQASEFWNKVLERTVACVVLSSDNHIYVRNVCGDSFEFGVDVFLTQEEAEQALKQMGE